VEQTSVWLRLLVVVTCGAAAFAGFKVSMAAALALEAALTSVLETYI
jgi:hypothetical protein